MTGMQLDKVLDAKRVKKMTAELEKMPVSLTMFDVHSEMLLFGNTSRTND